MRGKQVLPFQRKVHVASIRRRETARFGFGVYVGNCSGDPGDFVVIRQGATGDHHILTPSPHVQNARALSQCVPRRLGMDRGEAGLENHHVGSRHRRPHVRQRVDSLHSYGGACA